MLLVIVVIVFISMLYLLLIQLIEHAVASFIFAMIGGVYFYKKGYNYISKKIEIEMEESLDRIRRGKLFYAVDGLLEVKNIYKKWRFFFSKTIDGQIGMLYYMTLNYKKAAPFLERAMSTDWMAKTMLAVIAYKKKDYEKMDKVFEKALRYSFNSSFVWSVWAYCYWRMGKIDHAIQILSRARGSFGTFKGYFGGTEEKIVYNLTNIRNGKKMKMNVFGQDWNMLHLEQGKYVDFGPGQVTRFGRKGFH
ncbi:MAG: tetratricopeptide repeat protein [Deltaproteobacteria bacterium]|nr:MAG: tetratricopeptide repeat protein [Deltaproteobacteria bacterium]